MSSQINRKVKVFATELSPAPIEGVVVGASSDSIALSLSAPIELAGDETASYLVAAVRHENQSLSEIVPGQRVLCCITLVPKLRYNPTKPCDLSWWRGGEAAIGDVVLIPESPPLASAPACES